MPTIRSEAKPGRNVPCPCGSGRKHKACCLPKRERAEAEARRPKPLPRRADGGTFRPPNNARTVAGMLAILAWAGSAR